MALDYIYKKYKDIHTVENTGITSLSYTISTKNCDTLTPYKSGTIGVGIIFILPIIFTDSIYVVTLSLELIEEVLPDIIQYNNTLVDIVNGVEEILCGCEGCYCNECNDITECELNLNSLVAILSFSSINAPKYSNYIALINNYLKCTINSALSCYTSTQQIKGTQESRDLLLQIIALHYLAFYYTDLYQATNEEEVQYIKTKYKFSKILKCLKKIGINELDMEELFELDYTIYYWQLDNPSQDISNVLPLLDESYLSTKPSDAYEVFNQGRNIEYTNIGCIVFVIKDASSSNFNIIDEIGNNITNQFDIDYNSTTKYATFVSKIFYSYNTMFFKFEQNS